jgi:lactate dehydrogenase-like 2-hydroxyacid dehydrogenase
MHTIAELDQVVPWADIVVLAASHTPESANLANDHFFQQCQCVCHPVRSLRLYFFLVVTYDQ